MESFLFFFGSQDSLKNFPQVQTHLKQVPLFSPKVQTHLKQVYLLLCCGLVASGVGALLDIFLWDIGFLPNIVAAVACSSWLRANCLYQEQKRVLLFMASAFFYGASVGPPVQLVINHQPSILVSAFMNTAIAFGCFSGAAVLAKRRRKEFLYLRGFLSSELLFLYWVHFAFFTFTDSVFYFGMLIHVAQLVVVTQEIVEKAQLGDLYYVDHTFNLFNYFICIFIIMLKKISG